MIILQYTLLSLSTMANSSLKRKQLPEGLVQSGPSKVVMKEMRRKRGEIACAECRRLKVKCDRQVPCSTCVTRGCIALCPNGILPPGDNSRYVVHAKDHLQKKLSTLEQRARALEDALAILQGAIDTKPHPLLAKPFKIEDEVPEPAAVHEEEEKAVKLEIESISEAVGTLHIHGKEKSTTFFGPSGESESLLVGQEFVPEAFQPLAQDDASYIDLRALGLPEEINVFFRSFPLAPMGIPKTNIKGMIESCLPSLDRAESLCKIFLEHLSWMFQIVTYQQVTQELILPIYTHGLGYKIIGPTPKDISYNTHDLALLFMVLAIGSLVDFNLPAYNSDAQRYYVLARASIGLLPWTETCSLSTVKTMHLLSLYNGMSGRESNMANMYGLMNLTGHLAQRIGLHIDPSTWRLSPKQAYDRRCYYWNLLQANLLHGLGTGRPPAFMPACNTTRIPTEQEEIEYQKGEKYTIGFGIWGFRHTRHCLIPALDVVLPAKPPAYKDVLAVDQRIRSMAPPSSDETPNSPSIPISMRWFVRSHYMELALLTLHRGFFAQAMAEKPDNPMDSPYQYSFITAYRSACVVIDSTFEQWGRIPELLSRVWQVWTFAFDSAVIIGAVASKSKSIDISPSPLIQFERAYTLFERAGLKNSRAARGLPVLRSMRDQAINLHGLTEEQYLSFARVDESVTLSGQPSIPISLTGASDPACPQRPQSFLKPIVPPLAPQIPSPIHTPSTRQNFARPVGERVSRSHPVSPVDDWQQRYPPLYITQAYPTQGLHQQPQSITTQQPTNRGSSALHMQSQMSALDQWQQVSPGGMGRMSFEMMPPQSEVHPNFLPDDTWASFMQNYANMPPPSM